MKERITSVTQWAAAVLIVAALVFAVGPTVESKLFPPFDKVNAVMVNSSQHHVDVVVTGRKVRDCMLQSATGFSQIAGQTIISTVTLLKSDGSELSIGDQRIGVGSPFVRIARVSPGAENLKVQVAVSCHPFWTVKQTMVDIRDGKAR